ncbi:hypothetical protein K466DRAFT_607048 [Polyporus arcularius HHB13444]|uniref:Uncharacterized protein n=1 Tax=Polyporus arcularius HHB13444 TaxID=1314778 RepID=A0A5C3NY25_9APHY|nr:hypothetical protein K466DRAFT_607048 [Polyporus arcularius HHB13444]
MQSHQSRLNLQLTVFPAAAQNVPLVLEAATPTPPIQNGVATPTGALPLQTAVQDGANAPPPLTIDTTLDMASPLPPPLTQVPRASEDVLHGQGNEQNPGGSMEYEVSDCASQLQPRAAEQVTANGSLESISSWGSRDGQPASRDSTPLSFDFSSSARSSVTPTPVARPSLTRAMNAPTPRAEQVFGSGLQPSQGGPVTDLRGPPGLPHPSDVHLRPGAPNAYPYPLQPEEVASENDSPSANKLQADGDEDSVDYFGFFLTPTGLNDPPHNHDHPMAGTSAPAPTNYNVNHGGGALTDGDYRDMYKEAYDAIVGWHSGPGGYSARPPTPPDRELEGFLAEWKRRPGYKYWQKRL